MPGTKTENQDQKTRIWTVLSSCYWRLRWALSRCSPVGIFFRVAEWMYDRRYGIETTRIVPVDALQSGGRNAAHARRYNPSLIGFPRYLLNRLAIDHRNFTFVDIGSGKGRVLLEATSFPFRRIIGVEFSPTLHHDAERSVLRFNETTGRGGNIELLCMDAAEFAIPDENVVLYFYNPFSAEVMARVIKNICDSLQRSPRLMKILYLNPVDAGLFEASGAFVCERTGRFAGQEFCVYAAKAAT